MYEKFYGLEEPPFNLTPDSRFLFLSHRHSEALAAMLYGVRERKGFTLLTGEIGSGKTMLCRYLVKELEEEGTRVALILDSYVNELELLLSVSQELRNDASLAPVRKTLIDGLYRYLVEQHKAGRNVVVIIDEAQNLTDSVLEQIRLLGNLETEETKLLQIVLVGQPELQKTIQSAKLEQLNQRIAVRYHLRPFGPDEVEPYIQHRLRVAGSKAPVQFSAKAIELIYEYTGGVPRKINLMCDRALLSGYVASTFQIDEAVIRAAAVEVGADQWAEATRLSSKGLPLKREARWPSFRTVVYAAAVLAIMAGVAVGLSAVNLPRLFGKRPASTANIGSQTPQGLPESASDPTPTPRRRSIPNPAKSPGILTTTALPLVNHPMPETPWSYDSDRVVRVDRPEFARTAAELTLLSAWGIEVNLPDFRKLKPADMEKFDVIALNADRGLRSVEVRGDLNRIQVYDTPAVIRIDDPEGRLSPYGVLVQITPTMCTIADPILGLQQAPRDQLSVWYHEAWIIYFDTAEYGSLTPGSRLNAVKALQSDLKQLGFHSGTETGIYDAATVKAVEAFQRRFQVFPTGQMNPVTVMLLTTHRESDRPRLSPRKEPER
jgi:general secretion pathway protein A